jgi:hypothetical protein
MRNVISVLPTRLILTGSLQIIILMSFSVGGVAQTQVETMRKYLDALKTLDQDALEKFFAADAVFQRADGTQVPLDRRQNRRFREFERGTHTQWTYRIVGVKRDQVTVILTEQSEYYKLLGVGKRTSMVVYEVRDGLVHMIRTLGQVHESGDEGEAATAFHEWLDHQPAAAGIGLVRDGHLVYDAVSARTMLPWLRKWRSFQNLTNRRTSVEQDVGTEPVNSERAN